MNELERRKFALLVSQSNVSRKMCDELYNYYLTGKAEVMSKETADYLDLSIRRS